MKSKILEDLDSKPLDQYDPEDAKIVDEYKDIKIDTVVSSRKNFLQWNGLDDE